MWLGISAAAPQRISGLPLFQIFERSMVATKRRKICQDIRVPTLNANLCQRNAHSFFSCSGLARLSKPPPHARCQCMKPILVLLYQKIVAYALQSVILTNSELALCSFHRTIARTFEKIGTSLNFLHEVCILSP